jgi:hypothetical protein
LGLDSNASNLANIRCPRQFRISRAPSVKLLWLTCPNTFRTSPFTTPVDLASACAGCRKRSHGVMPVKVRIGFYRLLERGADRIDEQRAIAPCECRGFDHDGFREMRWSDGPIVGWGRDRCALRQTVRGRTLTTTLKEALEASKGEAAADVPRGRCQVCSAARRSMVDVVK